MESSYAQHGQAPPHQICLLVMCGLPGAGKTTLTNKLLLAATTPSLPCSGKVPTTLLIAFDAIIPDDLNFDRGVDDQGDEDEVCGDGDDTATCIGNRLKVRKN